MISITDLTKGLIFSALALFFISCEQEEGVPSDREPLFKKFYGTAFNEAGYDLEPLADGGYLLVGSSTSNANGSNDIYVARTDEFGDWIWEETFGGAGEDAGADVYVDNEGNYLVTGYVTGETGDQDYVLLKLNADGQLQDSLTVGRKGFMEQGRKVVETQDGGYVIGGNVLRSGQIVDNFLYKFTAAGDSVWSVSVNFLEGLGSMASLLETENGEIIWCSTSNKNNDASIIMGYVAADGLSNRLAFHGENDQIKQVAYDLKKTNLGYVLAGSSQETGSTKNMLLLGLGINERVAVKWDIIYETPFNQEAHSLDIAASGNFVLIGKQEIAADNQDILLAEGDFSGNIIWSKNFGGSGNDEGSQVYVDAEGNFTCLGTSEIENNNVITIVKSDKEGVL